MLAIPDKARMRSITELYYNPPDPTLRELVPDNVGPLTIGEAVSFIMDEPALSQNPLSVDPTLMSIINSTSEYLGSDDEANDLRMIHFGPLLSTLTRTAHVISPGTVRAAKRPTLDAHGRKHVGYLELPSIEFVYNDDVMHHHRTFNTYLDFAKKGVETRGLGRVNKVSICIAAKSYINSVCQILSLEVMRMERAYNESVRENLKKESRELFGRLQEQRAAEIGERMSDMKRQLDASKPGPNTLFDPDMEVGEEDCLVAL